MRSSALGTGWKGRGITLGPPGKPVDVQPIGIFLDLVEFVGFRGPGTPAFSVPS
jgi:hypothetical protein